LASNFSASRILITASKPLTMKTNNKRKFSKAPGGQTKRRKTQVGDSKPKRPVSVDALSWKTVDVPEMFDDAEGFYGLEVVEGVDIVNKDGTVQFVSFELWPEVHGC
jgi:ATP-dependent RNA helicase DDX24/MAK5